MDEKITPAVRKVHTRCPLCSAPINQAHRLKHPKTIRVPTCALCKDRPQRALECRALLDVIGALVQAGAVARLGMGYRDARKLTRRALVIFRALGVRDE